MAYIRRRRYGLRKRKMYGRKRRGGMRRKGGFSKKYHGVKYFTEVIPNYQTMTAPAFPAEQDVNLNVSFNQLPNFTTYVTLFKQFAITGIKFIYKPNYNVGSLVGGANGLPRMFFAEDKVSTAPDTIANISAQDNCKVLLSNKSWSKYIKMPQPVLTQGDGAGNQIQVQQRSKDIYWLDTTDHNAQNVLYLSGHLDLAGVTGGPIACGTLSAKVYIAFKEQY